MMKSCKNAKESNQTMCDFFLRELVSIDQARTILRELLHNRND